MGRLQSLAQDYVIERALGILREVGFQNPSIEPTRVYKAEDAAAFLAGAGVDLDMASQIDGKFMGAFVRATKPLDCCYPGSPCCGPDCCGEECCAA